MNKFFKLFALLFLGPIVVFLSIDFLEYKALERQNLLFKSHEIPKDNSGLFNAYFQKAKDCKDWRVFLGKDTETFTQNAIQCKSEDGLTIVVSTEQSDVVGIYDVIFNQKGIRKLVILVEDKSISNSPKIVIHGKELVKVAVAIDRSFSFWTRKSQAQQGNVGFDLFDQTWDFVQDKINGSQSKEIEEEKSSLFQKMWLFVDKKDVNY